MRSRAAHAHHDAALCRWCEWAGRGPREGACAGRDRGYERHGGYDVRLADLRARSNDKGKSGEHWVGGDDCGRCRLEFEPVRKRMKRNELHLTFDLATRKLAD